MFSCISSEASAPPVLQLSRSIHHKVEPIAIALRALHRVTQQHARQAKPPVC